MKVADCFFDVEIKGREPMRFSLLAAHDAKRQQFAGIDETTTPLDLLRRSWAFASQLGIYDISARTALRVVNDLDARMKEFWKTTGFLAARE